MTRGSYSEKEKARNVGTQQFLFREAVVPVQIFERNARQKGQDPMSQIIWASETRRALYLC